MSIIDPSCTRLTHRERFRRVMHFQTVDRGVHWEFGYLDETIDRWHSEGLPASLTKGEGDDSVEEYFGVDPRVRVPLEVGPIPPFTGDPVVLEEHPGRRIEQLPDGTIREVQTEGVHTIPHFIKMPIASRDDWKRYKERLDPSSPERHTVDFRALNEQYRLLDVPVGITLGSYYGIPRNLIGFEQISVLLYDDYDLIEEIVETFTTLYETMLAKALREVEVDFAAGWEDICFRNGPMISPQMFRKLVGPRLKRVCDLLRSHGVTVIWTDCDGNINDLVPIWLECGVNCMFPIEVHAGTDPVELRRRYGRQILLRGGIAKHQLSFGKKEILEELKRVEPLVEEGGYIPHGDHRIPEDVPYENYRYYVREKLAMLGWRPDEVERIEPLRGLS